MEVEEHGPPDFGVRNMVIFFGPCTTFVPPLSSRPRIGEILQQHRRVEPHTASGSKHPQHDEKVWGG